MKLTKSVDTRMIFRDIYYFLMWFFLADFLLRLIFPHDSFSLRSFFLPIVILTSYIGRDYSRVVFFEKPYIYLEYKGEKVSPLHDTPIRLPDITGYSVNNPFPSFSRSVSSSHNLTLNLLNGKHKTFSVKVQSILINWLNENNISCIRKTNSRAVIEHIILTAANLIFIVFYSYQIKTAYTEAGFTCLLISAVCFVYWIIYIVSGLYISKQHKTGEAK
ncbi:MAG TPA: hypothetical protein PLR39_09155 [Treponemataceae bacterium]|nr:hypothetical protein [Treponemataceae bacterium]